MVSVIFLGFHWEKREENKNKKKIFLSKKHEKKRKQKTYLFFFAKERANRVSASPETGRKNDSFSLELSL